MRLIESNLSLEDCAVLDDVIGGLVVKFLQDGTVPFDGEERVVDQVFDEDWSIVWFNDASAALFGPVALGAGKALPVHSLEDERLKEPVTLFDVCFPVSALPPAKARAMVLAVGFQQIAGNCPDFVVKPPSAGTPRTADDNRVANELRHEFLEYELFLLDEHAVVTDDKNVVRQ